MMSIDQRMQEIFSNATSFWLRILITLCWSSTTWWGYGSRGWWYSFGWL